MYIVNMIYIRVSSLSAVLSWLTYDRHTLAFPGTSFILQHVCMLPLDQQMCDFTTVYTELKLGYSLFQNSIHSHTIYHIISSQYHVTDNFLYGSYDLGVLYTALSQTNYSIYLA